MKNSKLYDAINCIDENLLDWSGEKSSNYSFKKEKVTTMSKKQTFKKIIAVCAVLVTLSATMFVASGTFLKDVFSKEWFDGIVFSINDADGQKTKTEFLEKMQKSDNPFVKETLSGEGGSYVLFDGKTEIDVNQTISNGGLDFTFKSIQSAKLLCNKVVSGNIMKGDAKMKWQTEDSLFAIFEISRTDNNKLSEKDKDILFEWNMYTDGYKPWWFAMTMQGNTIVESDDNYTRSFAIDITPLSIFAKRKLIISAMDFEYSVTDLILDKNGELTFSKPNRSPHAIFKFELPEQFADQKAVEKFNNEYRGILLDE